MKNDKFKILISGINTTLRREWTFDTCNLIKLAIILSIGIMLLGVFILSRPPMQFPEKRMVKVESGDSLAQISEKLKESHVIKSELLFEFFLTTLAGDGGAKHGEYFFEESISAYTVAKHISEATFGLDSVRVTVPEGSTIFDIARIFEKTFVGFNTVAFIEEARDKEGYLFPDTYFFLPNVSHGSVIKEMESTFSKRMEEIKSQVESFGRPLNEVVIMASIIEKETIKVEDKYIVSGILWKRIEIGMPLQVDATFLYINGKSTYALTYDDLEIDSPYNTYKYKGLPVGPIANPGLEALLAAVEPEKTPYLFYLSDRSSKIHYAVDFEEHKVNKRLFIN